MEQKWCKHKIGHEGVFQTKSSVANQLPTPNFLSEVNSTFCITDIFNIISAFIYCSAGSKEIDYKRKVEISPKDQAVKFLPPKGTSLNITASNATSCNNICPLVRPVSDAHKKVFYKLC
jgi:hypothetical protein